MIYINDKGRGYTLLFSIIVASIVLSIAAFILSVSRKQFILSASARDSTIAIYAADSGIQCAVEAYSNSPDHRAGNLAITNCYNNTSALNGTFSIVGLNATDLADYGLIVDNNSDPKCVVERTTPPSVINFTNSNTCSIVTFTRGCYIPNPASPSVRSHKTIIESRGYNIANSGPCAGNSTPNPRAVERAIRLEYKD